MEVKIMKFVIDRFEGEYAILENIDTQEMKEVLKEDLPFPIYEGSVLKFDGEKYFFDYNTTNFRRHEILLKFERLKSNTTH